MSILGKKFSAYTKFARTGMIQIVLMGLIRFFVGISGVLTSGPRIWSNAPAFGRMPALEHS